jgi:FkbM family methyltransferase
VNAAGRLSGLLRRRLLPNGARVHAEHIRKLESDVRTLRSKVERMKTERVDRQWSAPFTAAPLSRLDYDGAEIRVVAAARNRTARAQTKEPFTVAWIEKFIDGDAVFYDIGANVGSYALIAAARNERTRVVAFEPGAVTFAVLCSNIAVNDFDNRIIPVPLPLADETGVATLRYWNLGAGAGSMLGHVPDATDAAPVLEQRVLALRLDDAVELFGLPAPTHVKLDVDGAEQAVLDGAAVTLSSGVVRSLIVELAPSAEPRLVEVLSAHGYVPTEFHEQRAETGLRYATFERR